MAYSHNGILCNNENQCIKTDNDLKSCQKKLEYGIYLNFKCTQQYLC